MRQFKPIECVTRHCRNIIYVKAKDTHMLLQCEACIEARKIKLLNE